MTVDLVHTQHHVVECRHPRHQARRLKYDSAIRAGTIDFTTVDHHTTGRDRVQSGDHRQHGALAAAGVPEQRDVLAAGEVQVEILERSRPALGGCRRFFPRRKSST